MIIPFNVFKHKNSRIKIWSCLLFLEFQVSEKSGSACAA